MEPKQPNLYLVRFWARCGHDDVPESGRVWAFSVADALEQIRIQRGSVRVTYIGPYNPACTCLSECHCGYVSQ